MVFGPGELHRALPLSVGDVVEIREQVALLPAADIDRLVESWTMAIVHLPPTRPLDSLIPFIVADIQLAHLDLSRRARNGLNRAGWWTLREAATAGLMDIAAARNVGPGSLAEFVSAYVRHALTGPPLVAPQLTHGVLVTWLHDVVTDARNRGVQEIDIHIVERGAPGHSGRDALVGLSIPEVAAEVCGLVERIPEPRR